MLIGVAVVAVGMHGYDGPGASVIAPGYAASAPLRCAPSAVTATGRSRFRFCISWPSVIVRMYVANIGR